MPGGEGSGIIPVKALMAVKPISPDFYQLDLLHLGVSRVITAYLYHHPTEAVLIEPGPATTLKTLLADLQALEVRPDALRHVLLTHIHLDHAGASGHLAEVFPNANFYVHPVGLPHLADPTRLINSARRLYGEDLERLFGLPKPVPSGRLVGLSDSGRLRAGGRSFGVYYAPGHASHHAVFLDLEDRVLFAGDAAGTRMPGVDSVRPPTPPPDIDIEAWHETINRIRGLRPVVLAVAHAWLYADVAFHLADLEARLDRWAEMVLSALEAGRSEAEVAASLRAEGDAAARAADGEGELDRWQQAMPYELSALGLVRYWRKRRPDLGQS